MSRPVATIVLGLAVLAAPACGRKGSLELPPGRGPMAIEKFAAFQRGATIVVEWENPVKAVSGRPLDVAAVEIRAIDGPSAAALSGFQASDMEKRARPVRKIGRGEFSKYRADAEAGEGGMAYEHAFAGRRAGAAAFVFSARVFDARGRPSEFCPPSIVETRVCPEPPVRVVVRVFAEHVEIAWAPPGANIDGSSPADVAGYAAYRSEDGLRFRKITPSLVAGERFEDRDIRFGASYSYKVRALASGGVESGDSEVVAVEPRDIFAPAAPAGLVAVAGADVVSLSWEPVREPDLAGYRVFRKTAGQGNFAPLLDGLLRETSFTDPSPLKGTTVVYAVSALDLAGNESPKSETGPLTLKENRP